MRLLLEVVGSALVPLDSRKRLAEQGVEEGASVAVEVMAPEVLATIKYLTLGKKQSKSTTTKSFSSAADLCEAAARSTATAPCSPP